MDWVGAYHIYPHQTPAIRGARPVLSTAVLSRLLSVQTLPNVPNTIASVFTLCAHAQKQVSELALRSVQLGQLRWPAKLTVEERQKLRWNTLRDHIRYIAMSSVSALDSSTSIRWRDCPLLSTSGQIDEQALKHWFSETLLGTDVYQWWHDWQTHGVQALDDWTQNTDHVGAKICRTQLFLQNWAQGGELWLARADDMPVLWQQWSQEGNETFAQYPHLHGVALETGAWSRQRLAHALNANAWTRACARWVDAVALLMDDEAQYLQYGTLAVSDTESLAWAEMARGVLVHFVRLDSRKQAVERYGILAPTEWNFHPEGRLARTLAHEMHEKGQMDDDHAHIEALLAAFDPCVQVSIEG